MENVRHYYEEIQEGLKNENVGKESVATVNAFFRTCQQYYHYHLIREQMKNAERILKNYFDESEYIAQRKVDMNKETLPSFSLTDKLYLEFLGEIYDEYYVNEIDYDEFINSECFSENIIKCFKKTPDMLIDMLANILKYAVDNNLLDYVYDRNDFSFIHNAVKEVREALCMSRPSIDICVEKVVVAVQLEKIIACLNENNIAGAIFTVAQMTRALSDGSYSSYTPKSRHNSVYFNISSEYNLLQISKRIEDIKKLVSVYDATMDELNKYREISI